MAKKKDDEDVIIDKIDMGDVVQGPVSTEIDTDEIIDFLLIDSGKPTINVKPAAEVLKPDTDILSLPTESAEKKVYDQNPILEKPVPLPELSTAVKALAASVQKNNALQKFIGNPVENDSLVEVVRNGSSTTTVLNAVMEEIAEEAAFIKAWRNQNWDGGVDLSEATGKRIKMLRDLVETVVEREKLNNAKNVGKVDFQGENFQRVLKHFLEVIQKTFKKVNIPSQFEDIFFTQLAKEFDGFEKKAEKLYYGKD
jgi:hypothetical protein